MFIISVANRKGGTGKTTTCVNLAAEFSARGKKTLLIDLDTQGHSAWGVGFPHNHKFEHTVHQVFANKNFNFEQCVYETKFENLYFAPADPGYIPDVEPKHNVTRLRDAINVYSQKHPLDVVILDTPPTLDLFLMSALACSNVVIIPFLPHFLSAVGVRQMIKLFYTTAVKHNNRLKLLGLVPIMINTRLKMHRQVIEELSKSFGKKRILRAIRTNVKLAEAFNAGMPVRYYAPNSAGAMDYFLLAEDIEFFLKNKS
ncbi:MAG: ParA family protein [Desulfonauticus sp.]|nr:ParA family protein [Desulfonauticus sp.]